MGHKNILSIYRVISNVHKTNIPNDRWPYYVVEENLTTSYGETWNQHDITISNQREEVLSNNLFDITPSGKNSYGSLKQGADKLRITKGFGDYLVGKVIRINEGLM